MIRISRITFIVVSISLLSSCSWTRPNTTRSETLSDRYKCEQQALRMHPIMMVQKTYSDGYKTPYKTSCTTSSDYGSGYDTDCTTTGGEYVPPSTTTTDVNFHPRERSKNDCMYSKGYKIQFF
jgi:hypothetical protein